MVLKCKMYVDSGGVRKALARMLCALSAIIPQCCYFTVRSSGHALRDRILCLNFRKHETQLPERQYNHVTKSHFATQYSLANRRLTHQQRTLPTLTVPQRVKKFPAFYGTLRPYRVHNSPSLVPILNQINPLHVIPSSFFKRF